MDEPLTTQIQALVEPILAERELELVELTCRPRGHQQLIRLLVDKVGGVTIQQCASINNRIGQALDDASLIEGSYVLEVSSPGLDRPLVTKRDFERAIGEELVVELKAAGRAPQALDGMLLAVQEAAIVLKMASGNTTIPLAEIRAAKKAVRW